MTTHPTRIDEIGDGIYRISTPCDKVPGGFTFNQYLIADDQPLLFHTGGRGLFAGVRDAIARVLPVDRLRWISFSHVESDECGALNQFLEVAPHAAPLCGQVAAAVSIADLADRPPRALADGEAISLGKHEVRWIDAPHLPHAWECGFLFESRTNTLLCGDLFTQGGREHAPLVETDILGPSEAFRAKMDYFAHGSGARGLLDKLASLAPRTLACMHGAAWRGDGAKLLGALRDVLCPAGG